MNSLNADLVARVRQAAQNALPVPGSGATWERFHSLGALGREDLVLAKLVEPHHDAAAILTDLGERSPTAGSLWAVWAAEPPFARLAASSVDGRWNLDGRKAFCSGATFVTDALISADTDRGPLMFAVDMARARREGAVTVEDPDWVGAGMVGADTRTLRFEGLEAAPVGKPGEYVNRPGFWHGATGIAACWLGGALGVADTLIVAGRKGRLDGHGLAHLGGVTAVLDAASAHLATVASQIDANGTDEEGSARQLALSVRATVADAVEQVISRVGRALGPGPLAFDAKHSQRVVDLQVFVRQHHGERDLAELGTLVATPPDAR